MASASIFLTENVIPGASPLGRKPEELKVSELKFWLKCRGDTGKGLKTKAELVKPLYEYIHMGKDKQVVDPDPHKIYSRRKEKQGMTSEPDTTLKLMNQYSFLLYGLPQHLIARLQSIPNTAARVVTRTRKFDHIAPVLKQLHWLPVRYRTDFN